jgi:hypothetical protein
VQEVEVLQAACEKSIIVDDVSNFTVVEIVISEHVVKRHAAAADDPLSQVSDLAASKVTSA